MLVGEEDANDIFEFVGNAAGQRAHRFHFLGLTQLDFETFTTVSRFADIHIAKQAQS